MSKTWHAHAAHILDAIAKIERIQQRGDLTHDDVLYDATLRNLQTLPESTQRLRDSAKASWPAIPRHQISGFRNILVHNYLGDIDPQTVQHVVERHLPPLKAAVSDMLERARAPE